MDELSVLFGFIVGLIAGMHIGFERWAAYFKKREKREIVLSAEQNFIIFTTRKAMENYEVIACERKNQ